MEQMHAFLTLTTHIIYIRLQDTLLLAQLEVNVILLLLPPLSVSVAPFTKSHHHPPPPPLPVCLSRTPHSLRVYHIHTHRRPTL